MGGDTCPSTLLVSHIQVLDSNNWTNVLDTKSAFFFNADEPSIQDQIVYLLNIIHYTHLVGNATCLYHIVF